VKRFCVFGAGAVGSHIAVKLAAAGHQVSVVARGAHLQAVRDKGITLHTGGRTIQARVAASDRPADLGRQDAVFVTLKASGLRTFAEGGTPLLQDDTACVFVQNGIPWWYAKGLAPSRPVPPDLSKLDPGGMLNSKIGFARTVGAVVYSSNDLVEPGVVENHSAGRNMLAIAEVDGRQSARCDALRAALMAAEDLHSPPAGDLRTSVWNKLFINLGASLCVPLGEPIREVINDPALEAVRQRLMDEGRAIATAHGVDVSLAPRRPGGAQTAGATSHKPSMLQDYELGRPMEVEAILKTPLAFARAAGIPTPSLDALTAIIARMATAKGLYP
jgi:2-dehydropantoate 2-reductase